MLSWIIAGSSVGGACRWRSRLVFRIELTELYLQRPTAGGLHPFDPVALDEPHDADAGADALLGVRALAQDDLDQRRGLGADLAGLPRDPLRRPIGVALVARRHVFAHRRVLAVR